MIEGVRVDSTPKTWWLWILDEPVRPYLPKGWMIEKINGAIDVEISAQFLTRAQALDDAALAKQMVWYKSGATQRLAVRVVRATTHDIYPAGQIMYLRGLQGIPAR